MSRKALGVLAFLAFSGIVWGLGCQGEGPFPGQAGPIRQLRVVKESTVGIVIESPEVVGRLERVRVVPEVASVSRGGSLAFSALGLDAEGRPVPELRYVWQVQQPDMGRITSQGIFTAGTARGFFPNSIRVTAIQQLPEGARALSAFASLSILDPRGERFLEQITVYPPALRLTPGEAGAAGVLGWDANGFLVTGLKLEWSVVDERAGTINELGFFRAGQQEGFYPGAIRVDAIQETLGRGQIVQSGSLDVHITGEVRGGVLDQVVVFPTKATVLAGQSIPLGAVSFDASGKSVRGVRYQWRMVDSRAGSVDRFGVFTAGTAAGTYEAAVELMAIQTVAGATHTRVVTIPVEVLPPKPPAKLAAAAAVPSQVFLEPGERLTLVGAGFDEDGLPVRDIALHWSLTAPEVGVLNARGQFRAGFQPGRYPRAIQLTVRQDFQGEVLEAVSFADVTIVGPLETVEILPSEAHLRPRATMQFQAIGYDSSGTRIPNLRFRWSVLDPKAGSIDSSGRFSAGQDPGVYPSAIHVQAVQTFRYVRATTPNPSE